MDNNQKHPLDTTFDLYKYLSGLDQNSFEGQTTIHRRNTKCELANLCDIHGSDKGGNFETTQAWDFRPHSYTDYYARLFAHCRSHIKYVVECGIGTSNPKITHNMGPKAKPGASLRVWRDYFPNALVFGGDIDPDVLFSEARIRTYFLDQSCPNAIAKFWERTTLEDAMVDVMIDDGWHDIKGGIPLFENSFSKIAPGGIYIIEDIHPKDYKNYVKYFAASDYNYEFINFHRVNNPLAWNRLIVIRKP